MARKLLIFLSALVCAFGISSVRVQAQQTNSYKQTNLVSNTTGTAAHTDANLINPWGIAFFPGSGQPAQSPFWISDNNAGLSTLYDVTGALQGTFTVPPPAGASTLSTPTGIVASSASGFVVGGASSVFIFSTEDGTISGWNGNGSSAILAVDNSMGGTGAVYKGLAEITNSTGTFLLATNFRSGNIDVFDSNFHAATLQGTFTDPTLPAGFAPFGVHVIGNAVVVTYAMQNAAKHDPVNAAGSGVVSLFDLNGNFQKELIKGGNLNSPWGAVLAPAQGFGAFNGDLLVGNFGDGTIDAYNLTSGQLVGTMQDTNGQAITNLSMWDMVFTTGQDGNANTLFFTAGLANEAGGLFGTLTAAQTQATPDFSVAATASSATVAAGQSATFTITIGSLNNFNSAVALSCSSLPAAASCSFSPASVTPAGGSNVTTTLTISTKAASMAQSGTGAGMGSGSGNSSGSGMGNGMGMAGTVLLSLSVLGLFGFLIAAPIGNPRSDKKDRLRKIVGLFGLLVATAVLFTASGCSSAVHNQSQGTPKGTTTVMVTGTAGSLTHSISVMLTVK
ncbi:MAG: TIGR03118 family protein [Candidatus Acidiferrales bacterium]